MSNNIEREKFDYQPLGDDGGQYMVREVEAVEKEALNDVYLDNGDTLVLYDAIKVLKDNYSKKEFIVTGTTDYRDIGEFVAYEIGRDVGSVTIVNGDPAQTFKNLNIEQEFFEPRKLGGSYDGIKAFDASVKEALSDKTSPFFIGRSVSDRQAELSEELSRTKNNVPDARGELRGHALLSGLIRDSIHHEAENIDSLTKDIAALDRAVDAGFVSSMTVFNGAVNKANADLESARERIMHKSLMPSRVLAVEGELLNASAAESYTNNRFAALKGGQEMSLGDVSSKFNIRKLDGVASSVIEQQLAGYKSNSQLVGGVSLKQKGADTITHAYISKDMDDSLFVRAVTVSESTGEVQATDKESFEALGISPASLNQGEVAVSDGTQKTISYRDTQAREDNMLAQISPNNLRHLISESQIKNHYVNIAGISIDDIQPSVREPANIVEAYADDAFKITKFNKRQLSDLKLYADAKTRLNKDNEDITSAFLVENASGQKSIVGTIKNPSGTNPEGVMTFVENFDQDARRVPDHSLKIDYVAMGMELNSSDPDVDSVRVALQESRNFTSFAFDEQEGVPDRLAIPFGDERKPHPIVQASAEREVSLANKSAPDSQETLDNTSRTNNRIRR